MKYIIDVGKKIFEAELKKISGKDAQDIYEINLNKKKYIVNFVPGHVLVNNNSFEYEATYNQKGLPQSILLAERQEISVNIQSAGEAAAKPKRKPSDIHTEQTGKIKAPMNGQIAKILIKEGNKVKAHQILLILEAMKMENEIASPLDGIIKSINVKIGQSINRGDLLIEIHSGANKPVSG